jgi:hypothetical protein
MLCTFHGIWLAFKKDLLLYLINVIMASCMVSKQFVVQNVCFEIVCCTIFVVQNFNVNLYDVRILLYKMLNVNLHVQFDLYR